MLAITALYAGLLGLLSLYISFQAGSLRGRLKIPVGDGGNPEMLLAMRRHANFIEYVPLSLILMGLLEINGVPTLAIHVLGLALVATRASHAFGQNAESLNNFGRVFGAAGTALVILVSSIWAIYIFF